MAQSIDMTFPVRMLASYDDLGKIKKSAWVIEKGDYEFYVGNSVRNLTKVLYTWKVEEDIVVEQLEEKCAPKKLEKRLLADGTYEDLPTGEYPERNSGLEPFPDLQNDYPVPAIRAVPGKQVSWAPGAVKEGILFDEVADGTHTLDDRI